MAENYNVEHTHHAKHVRKRITQQKDVSKAPKLIYALKGLDQIAKPMIPQAMKEDPRRLIMQIRQLQANQLQRSQNQKTNFATIPNT